LEVNKGTITLTLDPKATIAQERLDWLLQYREGSIRFLSPQSIAIQTGQEEWAAQVGELNTILQGLHNAPSEPVQV